MDVMKAISTVILLVLTWSATGQYLTPIINEKAEGQYIGSSTMTDTKLIYQTKKDEIYHVWSMDLATKAKETIFTTDNHYPVSAFTIYNDFVYFTARNEVYERLLWRTDGTAANTTQISNEPLDEYGSLNIKGNQMFGINNQNQLLQLKNDSLVKLPITVSSIRHICVFGDDNFIVQTGSEASKNYTFKRLKDGVISNVYQYKANNNYQARFTPFKSNCFFRYFDYDDGLKVIQIPLQGEAKTFSVHADIPPIKRIFTHLDRLYVIAGEEYNRNHVFRLTPDLLSYDASVSIYEGFLFGRPNSFNELMVSVVSQNQYEPFSYYVLMDADLNFIPHHYSFFQIPYGGPTAVGADVLLGTDSFYEDAVLERFKPNGELEILSIKDHFFRAIISNSADFYLLLSNDNFGSSNIYALTDQPNITTQINGNWIEPDIINQGLVVQQGQRQDGSEYVFTTLYAFNEGRPIWLAGASELTAEQQKLTIDLYEYDGLELFEHDATPARTAFGQLQLELETCDRLKASISSEIYNQSLNLYRVDDTSFKYLCAEIEPLFLESPNNTVINLEVGHE